MTVSNFDTNFQDAHEFLIFLINHINEIIVGEQGNGQSQSANNSKTKSTSVEPEAENAPTWINEIFQVETKTTKYHFVQCLNFCRES